MKIAFLLYPTAKVKIDEDSSFWIMKELKDRGHQVYYFLSEHLFWTNNAPYAFLIPAKLHPIQGYLPASPEKEPSPLAMMDCIFIRKEPPFDISYLYALQLLNEIKKRVFILNDPAGLALSNEKLFSVIFKRFSPESLVTENFSLAERFIKKLRGKAVIKPLDNKGGTGIVATHSKDKRLSYLFGKVSQNGRIKVMIQRFVPASRFGDKRILILNGKPLGAFLRRPPAWDFRANLSLGGTMHSSTLTAHDRRLVETLRPELLARGLYFVGIDVIGKYLTEVNVTSPAGIPEINHFNKTRLEKDVTDFIEKRISSRNYFLSKETNRMPTQIIKEITSAVKINGKR